MSKATRPRQMDYSKLLHKIQDFEEFQKMDGEPGLQSSIHQNQLSDQQVKQTNDKPSTTTRQKHQEQEQSNIIIPAVQALEENTLNGFYQNKQRKLNYEYIRLTLQNNLPRNDLYDYEDDDERFFKTLLQKNQNPKHLCEFFEKLVETWEMKSEKDWPVKFELAKQLLYLAIEKTDKSILINIDKNMLES